MKNFMERVPQPIAEEIFKALDEIGIKQHYSGYNYLACAISRIIGDNRATLTGEGYPYVAKMFDTTVTKVERGMRYAIESLFLDAPDMNVIYKYFGNSISLKSGKVPNQQFVHTFANIFTRRMMYASSK